MFCKNVHMIRMKRTNLESPRFVESYDADVYSGLIKRLFCLCAVISDTLNYLLILIMQRSF